MENQTTERRQSKRHRKNWIPIVFFLLAVYIFVQAYLMNANGVDTVRAMEGYINDSVISQGIVCREETVLCHNSSGVVDYLTEDGERVSKGNIIAQLYPDSQDIEKLLKLRSLQQNLDDVNAAKNYIDGGILDISQTRKQLTSQLSDLAGLSDSGSYSLAVEELNDLTFSLNKIGVATGRTDDFTPAISQIKSEINNIAAGISRPIETFYSPYTGYFIQSTDGYEDTATVENFLTYSYQQGSEVINSLSTCQSISGGYGKIITDYKWYLCTYIDTAQAVDIYKGRTLKISLDTNSNNFSKATVEEMVDFGEKTLVILECTVMDKSVAKTRVSDCEILFKQYSGIKIPKSAIHFVDGQMGVYIEFSNVVHFRKISPIFEDDNYVIVPKTNSETNEIKLYDSIIVKGRNLYDGKYL